MRIVSRLVTDVATALRQLSCDERGVSAIEFALVAPLMVASLIGLVELGTVVYQRTDMHSAVRLGSQYIVQGGTNLDTARALVLASWTTKPETVSVTVSKYCLCAEAVNVCTAPCPDSSVPAAFTRIEATAVLGGVLYEYGSSADDTVRIR
jgi:Flp pilus assembly protein TadG